MPKKTANDNRFYRLVEIMAELRGPNGCPWDREQTHKTLRKYLIEECYEVIEAIDHGNALQLKEELGDLLLQVLFHARIAQENNQFGIDDVIAVISEKLIRRHPNVFGDVEINSAAEQSVNWEKIKLAEGKESVLDGVPKALSALLRAHRIQQKAATVGFDWPNVAPVWEKIFEEIAELQAAAEHSSRQALQEEYGDVLFALVNAGRFIDIDPEDALRATTEKFIRRFREIERTLREKGRTMQEATLPEMDTIWAEIKIREKSSDSGSSSPE